MPKITINVTAKDIREGKIASCETCPVARAFNRKIKIKKHQIVISPSSAICRSIPNWGRTWSVTLPFSAQKFITAFDRKEEVSPFKFTIEVPSVR